MNKRRRIGYANRKWRQKLNRDVVGLWRQLTPEQKAVALAYDGPENSGDPRYSMGDQA